MTYLTRYRAAAPVAAVALCAALAIAAAPLAAQTTTPAIPPTITAGGAIPTDARTAARPLSLDEALRLAE